MFKDRWKITGTLEIVTPLHIGTGQTRKYGHVKGRDEDANILPSQASESPDVATLIRAHDGLPILPASSLKGLLRRLAEGLGADDKELNDLLGTPGVDTGKDEQKKPARMGLLLPRTATASALVACTDMPYVSNDSDGHMGKGVFIAARTAVDAGTGTAATHKLFFAEMLAPGNKFALELLLLPKTGKAEPDDPALKLLLRILGVLTQAEGQPMGRSGGRIRLVKTSLAITTFTLTADGVLASRPLTGFALNAANPTGNLINLVCDGPFLIMDSSWDPKVKKANNSGDEPPTVPQIKPQRTNKIQPLVLEASIAGALRARARWLWGLNRLQAGADEASLPNIDSSAFSHGGQGKPVVVNSRADVDKCTPVERLFGVAGFQGLLEISGITLTSPPSEPQNLTSVALDRFSGAPLENALFTTQAFVGTKLDFRLHLNPRDGKAALTGDDETLFKLLLDDLKQNGLMLGHGSNKGYGWFMPAVGG